MKRLLGLVLLLTAPAFAQTDMVGSPCNMTDGSCSSSSSSVPATCTTAGQVPVFLGSPLALGCDAGISYDAATDALTTGAVSATGNVYAGNGVFAGVGVQTAATGQFTFGATAYTSSPDLGLARASAGVLKVTNGGAGAGKILVADGTAAAPSIAFASESGTGIYLRSAQQVAFAQGGKAFLDMGPSGSVLRIRASDAFCWSNSASDASASPQTSITSPAAATLQLGAANSATPIAQTLQAQGGSGTDIAGANLTIQSGAGTGAGAGSTITFKTPTATTTGTTAQTQATRMTLNANNVIYAVDPAPSSNDGGSVGYNGAAWSYVYLLRGTKGSKSKALTDATPVAFATFTIADGATYGGEIIYSVVATKGTAKQRLDGRTRFSATREGTTYTAVANEVGTQTLAAATGTLTGSNSIACTAGVCTISATFDTSQASPDTFVINPRFDSPDAGLALSYP